MRDEIIDVKNEVKGMLPVIFILLFVFIGSLKLPNSQKEQIVSPQPKIPSGTKLIDDNPNTSEEPAIKKEETPLIIIDAAHNPFGQKGHKMKESTAGEKFSLKEKDILECEVTYRLACEVYIKLKDNGLLNDIKVVILQEGNKEKWNMIEQLNPNWVIGLHVHKSLEKEKTIVYYKKESKGKKIVSDLFNKNDDFKLKEKKAKKAGLLKSIDSSFIIEFGSVESNLTKSWIEEKAQILVDVLKNYDFFHEDKIIEKR